MWPYLLDVDLDQIVANVRQINPQVVIIPVSAKTGAGIEAWLTRVRQATGRSSQPSDRAPHLITSSDHRLGGAGQCFGIALPCLMAS